MFCFSVSNKITKKDQKIDKKRKKVRKKVKSQYDDFLYACIILINCKLGAFGAGLYSLNIPKDIIINKDKKRKEEKC